MLRTVGATSINSNSFLHYCVQEGGVAPHADRSGMLEGSLCFKSVLLKCAHRTHIYVVKFHGSILVPCRKALVP